MLGIDSDNSEKAGLFTLNAREVTNRTIETWVESLGATVSYVSANPLLFFNGALHCLARRQYAKKFILSFDANDETSREIKSCPSSTTELMVRQVRILLCFRDHWL